jgi:hypothetical protein
MAAAIDWLDAYRAASLTIVSMYSKNATLECGCNGQTILAVHTAIAEYWYRRFAEMPAGELVELRPDADGVLVSYRVPCGLVHALLRFDPKGKIDHSRCGPTTRVS